MPTDNRTQAQSTQYPSQLAAIALRGASQMFDMQMTTMRTLWKTQARTAAAFGLPDCSDLFDGGGTEARVRQALSSSTEELLNTTQRANEAVVDVQRQFARIVQTQTANAAQNWQQGLQQLGAQTDDSLQQLRQTTQQQAEQMQRAAESIGEATRDNMREGGEQVRQRMQEGGQRSREAMSQASDVQRQQAETASRSANEEKAKRERAA